MASHPGSRRCPSCQSRIAPDATVCPICGHEFAQPEPAEAETAIVEAAPPVMLRRRRFSLAQLPWGVIGVVGVIAVLALGAVLLLQNTSLLTPAPVIMTVTLEAQGAAQNATATVTPTPILQATATATKVPPTSAPAPPTPTPVPPVEYEVKSGDTCGGIATQFDVPLSVFLAYNNLDENNCLIRVGDTVKIPPATPTPGPSATLPPGVTAEPTGTPEPTATLPPQVIVQVKGGDTCSDIAVRYRISVDTLVQQNGLDADCTLQIGQVLTLTFATPTPAISPTPIVAQTPTPRVGFDAPQLLSPLDGATISQTEDVVTLQWLSVGLLKDNEWYVVQIQPSGAITVPIFETKATSIKITRAILGDQPERSFAWWVQVKQFQGVDATTGARSYTALSQPSEVRRFTWSQPEATASPAPIGQ
ncbi:MAG: LysM peptidoglycan-binding domain-containing protein [Chloroflexi bacterium]|nr:LysM peptidoglycan-binding domain-containing protein [Chloroflexota bacterium]MCL5273128.1 LysM peptidoglycan-binding domain-containing protein [Chloroflexota bacterium]